MRRFDIFETEAAWADYVRHRIEAIEETFALLDHRLIQAQATLARGGAHIDAPALRLTIEALREDLSALAIHSNPADDPSIAEAIRRLATFTLH